MDKTYIYDERPGFESYNMMNFNTPGMPMIYPNMGYNMQSTCSGNSSNNNYESRITKIESDVDNLQTRLSRLEGSIYPQAVEYNSYPKTTYQNSLNMM